MKKSEFIGYCKRHEGSFDDPKESPVLRLSIRREHRGLNNILELDGVWCGQSILSVTIYTPTPGRQFNHRCYQDANEKLEKAKKKYQRWLDEFLAEKLK